MKTSVARTWNSLASKLHPPLPLSLRDSQRLLSLLNASFKKQFDRTHPADSSSNEHYASLHLQSILTNPLFDAKPRTRASPSSKSQSSGKRLEQLQNHMKRPMDAFKERVSQGTADLRTAKFFLLIEHKDCLASPATTLREAMQSSGVASTILQWLWSSGIEDTGAFLRDRQFVLRLIPFLVAEGQYSRIMRWMDRCNNPEETPFSSLHGERKYRLQSFLFERLILEETRVENGLDTAIALFLRIMADVRSFGLANKHMRSIAIHAAWVLTKAILRLPKAVEPEPSNVQHFLETMRSLNVDPLLTATICVYLPKRPDPQPTLTYFQNISAEAIASTSPRQQPYIMSVGLKAAELFLQDGRQSEALWIMEFLQTNFARELGLPLPRTRKISLTDGREKRLEREEASLYLLDTLTV
ncbi:MAG: hypothetical protein ASARMPREDX12_005974 [Alectoria sarmentosa]|nr:MAG: hypothetical protein ASARMPREDX12_005974 [Alectoria sarmentosa]